MKVVWTIPADEDREKIISFIAQDNLDAALEIDDLFTSVTNSLEKFPLRGFVGRENNSRELVVHRNYIIIYGIDGDTIYIKSVLHTSRQSP